MSFKVTPPPVPRLNRCELAVPGSSPKFFEKAAGGKADVVFLDLEDAVAVQDKEPARKNVIQALNDIDWQGKGKSVSVRINGLDTQFAYRDIVDVVEQAGHKLDMVMIPKVGTAADVYAVDMLLSQIELAKGIKKKIGIEVIIETALGMQNISEIAASSPRLESLHFGVADYAASTRARSRTRPRARSAAGSRSRRAAARRTRASAPAARRPRTRRAARRAACRRAAW